MVMINGLAIFSLAIITIVGVLLLVFRIHPTDHKLTVAQAFWDSLVHIIDPGVIGTDPEVWWYRAFMMFTTLLGLVLVSTLIGLVSNGILTKMHELRKGRSFVIEKDHLLILGWSSKIFTVISEICIANENQKRGVIVILADKDKVEMEDEIRDKVGNTGNTEVICRTGSPIDVDDLYIANPFDTKSIIILDKDNENSDYQIIKTIVAIVTNPDRRKSPYHITAEIQDEKNLQVAKMVGKNEVELILSEEIISRIMVQTSRQSGLSVVYIELMDFGGDEIYFVPEISMIGKTFKEILFAYEDSAIIGLQYADSSVEINPPMDTVFKAGDKIIGITEDDDTLVPNSPANIDIEENKIVYTESDHKEPESILVLGWNNRAKYIIKELDHYVQKGSNVKVISKFADAAKPVEDLADKVENIHLSFETADTTDRETLEKMQLDRYDFIILLCYQNYFAVQEADAQTLITLLHLRNFTELNGNKYKVVSEMLDIRNRQLADITSADDFIVSDNLISLLMSQVSENKYLMRVFEELFEADGSEIYIKPANQYVRIGEKINFYTILEAATRKNEIAIGYRIVKESKDAHKGYGIYVNPPKSNKISLSDEDMLIVLSEN